MHIYDLLAELGRRQTGTPFALDGSGVCRIAFDDGKLVDIEPIDGSDTVHIYSSVAPLPVHNADTVYGKLLTANLFGSGASGAWFAVDPTSEEIVLNRSFDVSHMDADRFEELVVGFMEQIRTWSKELSGPEFAELVGEEEDMSARPLDETASGEPMLIIRG